VRRWINKAKRERSDMKLFLESSKKNMGNINEKIKNIIEFDNRSGNIHVRVIEFLKLFSMWNMHEENKYLEAIINPHSPPTELIEKKTSKHKLNKVKLYPKSGQFDNGDNLPSIGGKLQQTSMINEELMTNMYPGKPSFPPIEYNDFSLTKNQVYTINNNLITE